MIFRKITIFTILWFLLFFIFINLTSRKIITAGDNSYLFFVKEKSSYSSLITNENNGVLISNAENFPMYSLRDFLYFLNLPIYVFQSFYFSSLYFIGILFSYLFFKKFVDDDVISILCSLIYGLNTFTIMYPFQDRFIPLVAFLPLQAYLVLMYLRSKKLHWLLLFSLVSNLYVISYINIAIILVFYFILCYFIISYLLSTGEKINLSHIIFLFLVFILLNLWWLYSFVVTIIFTIIPNVSGLDFTAYKVGSLSDNLRFIGQWSWYTTHYLYPYINYNYIYYNIFSVLLTYIPLIFILFMNYQDLKYRNKNQLKGVRYLVLFFVLSILLVNGGKHYFGYIFELLYLNVPYFKMFREPWAKFSIMLGVSYALVIISFFYYFEIDIKLKRAIYILLGIYIIFMNLPLISADVIFDKWNGTMRTAKYEVPEYWLEFKNYASENNNETFLEYPSSGYGAPYNWEYGLSVPKGVTNLILDNPVYSSSQFGANFTELLNSSIYEDSFIKKFNKNYLEMIGIDNIVLQNDLDWRYLNIKKSPKSNIEKFEKLNLINNKNFGHFSKEYLSKIPNDEPNIYLNKLLYDQLIGLDALKIYDLNNQTPDVYIKQRKVSYSGSPKYLYLYDELNPSGEVYVESNENPDLILPIKVGNSIKEISYINPTDYNVFPEANVNPNTVLYPLVRLKEILLLSSRFNLDSKINTRVWHSLKRIKEIERYPNISERKKNRLVKNFEKSLISLPQDLNKLLKKNSDWLYSVNIYNTTFRTYFLLKEAQSTLYKNSLDFNKDNLNSLISDLEEVIVKYYEVCNVDCYKYNTVVGGFENNRLQDKIDLSHNINNKLFYDDVFELSGYGVKSIPINNNSENSFVLEVDYFAYNDPIAIRVSQLIDAEYLNQDNDLSVTVAEYGLKYFDVKNNNIQSRKIIEKIDLLDGVKEIKIEYLLPNTNNNTQTLDENLINPKINYISLYTYDNVPPIYINESFVNNIELDKSEISYIKISDTMYLVKQNKLTYPSYLFLRSNFNKNWKLKPINQEYFDLYKNRASNHTSFDKYNVHEYILGGNVSNKAFLRKVFHGNLDFENIMLNGFATGWVLNTNSLPEYFMVVYEPQYITEMFLLVSKFSVAIIIFYILFTFVYRKHELQVSNALNKKKHRKIKFDIKRFIKFIDPRNYTRFEKIIILIILIDVFVFTSTELLPIIILLFFSLYRNLELFFNVLGKVYVLLLSIIIVYLPFQKFEIADSASVWLITFLILAVIYRFREA